MEKHFLVHSLCVLECSVARSASISRSCPCVCELRAKRLSLHEVSASPGSGPSALWSESDWCVPRCPPGGKSEKAKSCHIKETLAKETCQIWWWLVSSCGFTNGENLQEGFCAAMICMFISVQQICQWKRSVWQCELFNTCVNSCLQSTPWIGFVFKERQSSVPSIKQHSGFFLKFFIQNRGPEKSNDRVFRKWLQTYRHLGGNATRTTVKKQSHEHHIPSMYQRV